MLCHRAQVLGDRFHQRALAWQERYAFIGDVRGLGAMRAIELKHGSAQQLANYCLQHGVIILTAGTNSNVVRLLMPLVISDSEFEEAMQVLEDGLATLDALATQPSVSALL